MSFNTGLEKLAGHAKKAAKSALAGAMILAGAQAYTNNVKGEVEVSVVPASDYGPWNEFFQGTSFDILLVADNSDKTNMVRGFRWKTPVARENYEIRNGNPRAFDSTGHLKTSALKVPDFFIGKTMDSHNNELSKTDNVRLVSQGSSGITNKVGIIGIYRFNMDDNATPGRKSLELTDVVAYDGQGNEQKVKIKNGSVYIFPTDVNPIEKSALFMEKQGTNMLLHATAVPNKITVIEYCHDLNSPAWTEIARGSAHDVSAEYIEKNYQELPKRFYRARIE